MRTGENNRDLTTLEKKAGQKAAKNVRAALKATISPFKDTGTMVRSLRASAKMKFGGLDNIAINATNVMFIQHYGFEKLATNRVKYTLEPRGYFTTALNKTNALEVLADEIGAIRAEEVTSKIIW